MRNPPSPNRELVECWAEAYAAGHSADSIADRSGYHQVTVSKYMRELHIHRGRSAASRSLGRRILALRLNGRTWDAIAEELAVHESTVADHLREAGYPGRQNRPTTEHERQRIRKLRAAGLTYLEIARRVGRDHKTVRAVVGETEGSAPRRPRAQTDHHDQEEVAS